MDGFKGVKILSKLKRCHFGVSRHVRTLPINPVLEDTRNEVAAMSARCVSEIVSRAGHLIQFDRSGIGTDAIGQVFSIARE